MILPLRLPAGGEDPPDVAVRLSFGLDGELSTQGAVSLQAVVRLDADVVVLGSGDGCDSQVGTFGQARQVVLLLFGAAPQLSTERYPGRVERYISAIG